MLAHVICTLTLAAGVSGCAAEAAAPTATSTAGLDAYVHVAKRIYASEVDGPPVRASLRRIEKDRAAMAGNRAAMLSQLFKPGYHVVRLRVVKHGRVVNDVGGRFVVAGPSRAGMTISIQDVIGYVKLVHRLTGQGIVVRGAAGHVAASSSTLARATLPESGTAVVAGSSYNVVSFTERGFGGEPLRVWLLDSNAA
jgi:hypothetical protein